MTGIYIHIPFCRKACRYCDFCFIVSLQYLEEYLSVLSSEILQRKSEVKKPVSTIYFGGGTPSVMSNQQLEGLLELLHDTFNILPEAEVTMEANPDDLSVPYLKGLRKNGINRLSIGVQSFRSQDLELMNRSHEAEQALQAVSSAFQAGIENISIDLIYGLPNLSLKAWEENVKTAFSLPVKHLSAYHLTYEQDTIYHKWLKEGRITEADEELSVSQYEFLHKYVDQKGFTHYEVSNFSLPGYHSQHNSIYWNDNSYTGFGASAHSYDGTGRQWNLDNVKNYMQAIKSGKLWYKREVLTEKDRYHDYLVTKLRTKEGINFMNIEDQFGKVRADYMIEQLQPFLKSGDQDVILNEYGIKVTPRGWLRLDTITRALMID